MLVFPVLQSPNKQVTKLNRMESPFLVLQLVVLSIIFPTVDSVSDMFFCWNLATADFLSSKVWAALVALPILLNFAFTVAAYLKSPIEPRWGKWLDRAALIFQVWPQFFVFTIVFDILTKKSTWAKRRDYYNKNVSTIEPFVEAFFQVVIKLCLWTVFKQPHMESAMGGENPLFDTALERMFFYFTISSSMVTSLMGCIRFFKEGPVRFLPEGPAAGFFTLKYLLTFVSVFFNATAKVILLLLMVFYSLGVYGVVTPDRDGLELVGTKQQPRCDCFGMVQACRDGSFQLRRHNSSEVQLSKSWSEEESSSHQDWRVFERLEGNKVIMFWDSDLGRWWDGKDACLQRRTSCTIQPLKNFCGYSACKGTRIYCEDVIDILTFSRLLAVALWFSFNILPQILLASLVLFISEKKAFLRVALLFPELILSPYLTNIMFGPQFGISKSKTQPSHVIQMKKSLCWVNVLLSILGQVPTFYVLYSYLEEINEKATFASFLVYGYSNPLRRNSRGLFIPPYLAILSLLLAIVSLLPLLHLDNLTTSSNSFLAPLRPRRVAVTVAGLKELQRPKKNSKDQQLLHLYLQERNNDK